MTTSQVMCKFELESFKEVASNHKEKKRTYAATEQQIMTVISSPMSLKQHTDKSVLSELLNADCLIIIDTFYRINYLVSKPRGIQKRLLLMLKKT